MEIEATIMAMAIGNNTTETAGMGRGNRYQSCLDRSF